MIFFPSVTRNRFSNSWIDKFTSSTPVQKQIKQQQKKTDDMNKHFTTHFTIHIKGLSMRILYLTTGCFFPSIHFTHFGKKYIKNRNRMCESLIELFFELKFAIFSVSINNPHKCIYIIYYI